MSSDPSSTNIRMVEPKGPRIVLGVLALAAVGGVTWWLLRPSGPVGAPEDPRKILVVGEDADVATTLRELGLLAELGSFDALAAEGAQQAAKGTGMAAILHLADVRGIGYVALEDPASHGLEGLTVTGDSHDVTAEHRWAVFSVGDLGMPPKVTVDAEPSELPLPSYVEVLRAAFAQQRLASTLFAENLLPMDAVELHRAIEPAVDLYSAYAVADRRVAENLRSRTYALVDAERAQPKPAVLAGPLETTEVLALGDGTVLIFVQAQRLVSSRDVLVSLQPATKTELWFHAAGSSDPKARRRCGSLRGGTIALGSTKVVMAARGDALLLEVDSDLELWTLDAKAGACAWSRKGVVPPPLDAEYTWGVPHASGKVLRPAMPREGLAINLWAPGADRPERVPLPGCSQIGDPVWLDEGHFAVACVHLPETLVDVNPYLDEELEEVPGPSVAMTTLPPAQGWIHLVRLSDARAVAIPGTVLGEPTGIYTLHAVPSGKGLDLLAVPPWGGKLLRLRGDESHAQLLAGAEAAGEGGASVLPSKRFTVTPIDVGTAELDALALSPDGTRIVFTADSGHEVRVMQLDGGATTTVAKSPQAMNREPRFTADGKAVVFTSEFDGNERTEQVGRLAVLGQ